jgi:hypothetical protein
VVARRRVVALKRAIRCRSETRITALANMDPKEGILKGERYAPYSREGNEPTCRDYPGHS